MQENPETLPGPENTPSPDGPTPPPIPPRAAPPPLPQLSFSCTCGAKLKAPIHLAGKPVKCPACSAIVIARPSDEVAAMVESADIDESLTPLAQQVQEEIEKLKSAKRSVMRNILTLAVTLVFFVIILRIMNATDSDGQSSMTPLTIVVLIGALFFHELGHLVAMKIFRYKDVHMFFIPMLGAAVSGSETNPSSTHKAIVSLMGPLPGLVLGLVCWTLDTFYPSRILKDATAMLLILNIFNLLPFHPLDGGRFLDDVLFSRSPKIELWFKVVTTSLLLAVSLLAGWYIIAAFTVMVILSLRPGYATAMLAQTIKEEIPSDKTHKINSIPPKEMNRILTLLRNSVPEQQFTAPFLAPMVNRIWQKVCDRPPSTGAIVGLLFLYFAIFAALIVATVGIALLAQLKKTGGVS